MGRLCGCRYVIPDCLCTEPALRLSHNCDRAPGLLRLYFEGFDEKFSRLHILFFFLKIQALPLHSMQAAVGKSHATNRFLSKEFLCYYAFLIFAYSVGTWNAILACDGMAYALLFRFT